MFLLKLHPMLRLTVASGVFAVLFSICLPLLSKRLNKLLLAACIVAIAYLTIFRRAPGAREIDLIPFRSYARWHMADVRWQVYMNVFLFMPLGALLKKMKITRPILAAMLISVCIEAVQYFLAMGYCETDDVIHNTIGAAIGCGLYLLSSALLQQIQKNRKPSR